MKTQLLEDIGQSATMFLVPSGKGLDTGEQKGEQEIAQALTAVPAKPRAAFGVWRQKPAGEPPALAMRQPEPQAPPLEPPPAILPNPAVEAQHVHPEPTLAPNAPDSEPVPHGTVFNFTPPSPTMPAPDLYKREPSWVERWGRRYLLWGSCVLAGALLIEGGWWLYGERKDAATLALVADELKATPHFDKAVRRRVTDAKAFTLGPGGEVKATPVVPDSSPRPLPLTARTVPPLVLLDPAPAANTKLQPTAVLEVDQKEFQVKPEPERGAQQAPAAPLPNAVFQAERERLVPPSRPARPKAVRAPDHPVAREPAMQAAKKMEPESSMSATLKACREHGYAASQCVKHACSVTKYGFVCRGQ